MNKFDISPTPTSPSKKK